MTTFSLACGHVMPGCEATSSAVGSRIVAA